MWNVIPAWALDAVFGYQSANKLRDNLLALASRRDAGDASDEGDALGRAAATVAALLRASRDGVGNGVGLRALPPGAGRDGTGSTVRPIVCAPPRSFVFLLVAAAAAAAGAAAVDAAVDADVDAEGGDRLGAGPAIVVSDGVGNFASTLSATAVSAGGAPGVAIATVVSA